MEAIEEDWPSSVISGKRKAMLEYAAKLTSQPQRITAEDVNGLHQVGFSDIDILHIAEITGYYAYVNRIADGLGVMIESE